MSYDIPEDKLTQELCLYQGKYGTYIEAPVRYFKNDSDYVCVSEPIIVTFTPLDADKILQARVKALDVEIESVRARDQARIDDLKDQKQRLLAITQEPS